MHKVELNMHFVKIKHQILCGKTFMHVFLLQFGLHNPVHLGLAWDRPSQFEFNAI